MSIADIQTRMRENAIDSWRALVEFAAGIYESSQEEAQYGLPLWRWVGSLLSQVAGDSDVLDVLAAGDTDVRARLVYFAPRLVAVATGDDPSGWIESGGALLEALGASSAILAALRKNPPRKVWLPRKTLRIIEEGEFREEEGSPVWAAPWPPALENLPPILRVLVEALRGGVRVSPLPDDIIGLVAPTPIVDAVPVAIGTALVPIAGTNRMMAIRIDGTALVAFVSEGLPLGSVEWRLAILLAAAARLNGVRATYRQLAGIALPSRSRIQRRDAETLWRAARRVQEMEIRGARIVRPFVLEFDPEVDLDSGFVCWLSPGIGALNRGSVLIDPGILRLPLTRTGDVAAAIYLLAASRWDRLRSPGPAVYATTRSELAEQVETRRDVVLRAIRLLKSRRLAVVETQRGSARIALREPRSLRDIYASKKLRRQLSQS